jgi:hypothetical protein
VEADSLFLNLMGSGRLGVAGKAKSGRAELHGSGSLDAEGLSVDDAQIVADTAGTIRMAVVRSAKVSSSASGDVELIGKPACTVKALGSGQVRCGR